MSQTETDESPIPITLVPTQKALALMQGEAEAEAEARALVVAEALTWDQTPYRQQGYEKGPNGAVDCSMLLVAAYVGSGLVEEFDPRPYPPTWYLHHSEERYLAWMQTLAIEVQTAQPGDIALFKFGRCFSHSGIFTHKPNQIVHAAAITGKCTLGDLSDPELRYFDRRGTQLRPMKIFDVWAHIKQIANGNSNSISNQGNV